MIDPFNDELLSLKQAARLCPSRRAGRGVEYSALWRWCTIGKKGFVLETVTTPSGRFTTRAALAEFFEKIGAASQARSAGTPAPAPGQRSPAARQKASERATRDLARLGV